jgi:uncharacterized protein
MKPSLLIFLVFIGLFGACETESKKHKGSENVHGSQPTVNKSAPKEQPRASPPVVNGGRPQSGLKVVQLLVGEKAIKVEVAASFAERRIGLMNRNVLAEDEGMIFVYREKEIHSFWMQNCLIPLSVAYIRDDGIIAEIIEMAAAPNDPEPPSYTSSVEVRYCLEMNSEWFKKNKLAVGTQVLGIEQAVAE